MPAFFVLGVDYNPNATPEILTGLNKVGKNIVVLCIGFRMVKFIGKTNTHCYGILY